MRKKRVLALALAVMMTGSMSMTTLAGQWEQENNNVKYQEDNGSYPVNTWKWIDGNNDGVAECYYFDGNGYMLSNTTTPDGYQVNASGAWVVNGIVQTQGTGSKGNAGHSANYDPAHPLAGKIDAWNLRLPTKYLGEFTICNDNVQAMLTGQMDQYYMPQVGYSVNPTTGTQAYFAQEDHDNKIADEQALYTWFCNWLNGMDFENMSEMDKAKEIQKIFKERTVVGSTSLRQDRSMEYSLLIEGKGSDGSYTVTATALAKALGLKSAVNNLGGGGDYTVYYIQVDGKAYRGMTNNLNLSTPTTDNVYFSNY